MRRLLRALAYVWAAPNTLLGLAFAVMAVLGGAHAYRRAYAHEAAVREARSRADRRHG